MPDRLHVALLSPTWPPGKEPNGIVTYVAHLRAELLRQGHRVSVIANRLDSVQCHGPAYAVRPLHAREGWRRLRAALQGRHAGNPFDRWGEAIAEAVLRVHRRDPIDVVEMEESFGWCDDVQRQLPMPVVVKLHGPAFLSLVEEQLQSQDAQRRVLREGEALAACRVITSPSGDTLHRTRQRYGLPPDTGTVIRNPIAMPEDLPPWGADAVVDDSVLFVGRFDKRKGGDFLLRAFARLHASRPSARLRFVGPDLGVLLDDGSRVGLQAYAHRFLGEAARRAVEHLGPLAPDQIPMLRARAAVTVVCSRWDNQPNTALEAMLQSCPVVSTDAGSMGEVLAHERTGLMYKAGDSEDFCRQVVRLLDDRALAARLGAAARREVLARHAPSEIAAQTLDVYRRAIAAAPARRSPSRSLTPAASP